MIQLMSFTSLIYAHYCLYQEAKLIVYLSVIAFLHQGFSNDESTHINRKLQTRTHTCTQLMFVWSNFCVINFPKTKFNVIKYTQTLHFDIFLRVMSPTVSFAFLV